MLENLYKIFIRMCFSPRRRRLSTLTTPGKRERPKFADETGTGSGLLLNYIEQFNTFAEDSLNGEQKCG